MSETGADALSTTPVGNPSGGASQLADYQRISLKKNYLNPLLGIGTTKGRHTLELSYDSPIIIGKGEQDHHIDAFFGRRFKAASLGLYYYFSLFP